MKTLTNTIRNVRASNKSPESRTEAIMLPAQGEGNYSLVRNWNKKNLKVTISDKEQISLS